MEDLADDPREFSHAANVDFDDAGSPPGIDTFLCTCPTECGADYPPNFRPSHLAESDGTRNGGQSASDSSLQFR